MPLWCYRCISDPSAVKQIRDERKVQSLNPRTNRQTWYTPTRYSHVSQAQQELALPQPPTHRVGPIADADLGSWAIPLRRCPPMFGQPGGGLEMATYEVVWLCGLWNFNPGTWEL